MKEAHGEEMADRESTSIVNPETEEWMEEDTIDGMAMAAICSRTGKCGCTVSDADAEEKVNEDFRQAEQERETDMVI